MQMPESGEPEFWVNIMMRTALTVASRQSKCILMLSRKGFLRVLLME